MATLLAMLPGTKWQAPQARADEGWPIMAESQEQHTGKQANAGGTTDANVNATAGSGSGTNTTPDDLRESGRPGGRVGRRVDARGSGVYPAAGPRPLGNAPFQPAASWAHGR